MTTNRFNRTKELVNIQGFEFIKLGSLQLREQQYSLNIKKQTLDNTHRYIQLAKDISQAINITEKEAWTSFQSGLQGFTPEQQSIIAPILMEFSQYDATIIYGYEMVKMLLMTRLENITDIYQELNEAFNTSITEQQANLLDKLPNDQRLINPLRKQVCANIVDSLYIELYGELLEFITNEEQEWKTITPSNEPEPTDPN
jgi:hypothetical protein